ncbi:MAG: hypothetical protein ACHP9Y_00620, partial [Gammaproteobacteria bacterium]
MVAPSLNLISAPISPECLAISQQALSVILNKMYTTDANSAVTSTIDTITVQLHNLIMQRIQAGSATPSNLSACITACQILVAIWHSLSPDTGSRIAADLLAITIHDNAYLHNPVAYETLLAISSIFPTNVCEDIANLMLKEIHPTPREEVTQHSIRFTPYARSHNHRVNSLRQNARVLHACLILERVIPHVSSTMRIKIIESLLLPLNSQELQREVYKSLLAALAKPLTPPDIYVKIALSLCPKLMDNILPANDHVLIVDVLAAISPYLNVQTNAVIHDQVFSLVKQDLPWTNDIYLSLQTLALNLPEMQRTAIVIQLLALLVNEYTCAQNYASKVIRKIVASLPEPQRKAFATIMLPWLTPSVDPV